MTPDELRSILKEELRIALKDLNVLNHPGQDEGLDEWLNVKQVATRLNKSRTSIYKYWKQGIIPGYRLGKTNRLAFKQSDVDAAYNKVKFKYQSSIVDSS